MNKYLLFFLGIICLVIAMYFMDLQMENEITTWHSVVSTIFFAISFPIFNNLIERNFFSKFLILCEKIGKRIFGKYDFIFFFLTLYISIFLLFAVMRLISNIVGLR